MSRDYTFTHIYKIDLDSDHVRKTTGVVLPMISGLYFVGGQEQRSADTQNGSSNYRTLKVIAAQWLPVERNQLVIPALVLSTNNREEIIISRLALRRTLITDHVSAEVGIISSEKLEDDLQKLVDVEMSFQRIATAAVTVRGQKRQIMAATNNRPPVNMAGFFRKGSEMPLTKGMVEGLLQTAFQDDSGAQFVDGDGNTLTWENLRFGPLKIG